MPDLSCSVGTPADASWTTANSTPAASTARQRARRSITGRRRGAAELASPGGRTRGQRRLGISESRVEAKACHDGGAHVPWPPRCVEGLLQAGLDDLQVEGRVEPPGERRVVVHLDRVFTIEPQIELLAEKRRELVAELDPGPADPERVPGATRDRAL